MTLLGVRAGDQTEGWGGGGGGGGYASTKRQLLRKSAKRLQICCVNNVQKRRTALDYRREYNPVKKVNPLLSPSMR